MKSIKAFPKRRCVLLLRNCTCFWEKCENGHDDVSEKICAAIKLFRDNEINEAFPKRRYVLPLRTHTIPIRLCGGSNTLRNLWIEETDFSGVSLRIKMTSFGGTLCIHHVDS